MTIVTFLFMSCVLHGCMEDTKDKNLKEDQKDSFKNKQERRVNKRFNYTVAMIMAVIPVVFLSGCATPITQEQMAQADFGPYPKNYQAIIKRDIAPTLVDPTSPLYTFDKPVKQGRSGNPPLFGWRVCGTINSKNRMGGYSGPAQYYVMIRNGHVIYELIGDSTDDNPIMDGLIRGYCGG
jgi:hypothetical protein